MTRVIVYIAMVAKVACARAQCMNNATRDRFLLDDREVHPAEVGSRLVATGRDVPVTFFLTRTVLYEYGLQVWAGIHLVAGREIICG